MYLIRTYVLSIHTYIHTYIRTYIHTYIHTYVCKFLRTNACKQHNHYIIKVGTLFTIYSSSVLHVRSYVHIYIFHCIVNFKVCTYVRMYVCTYVCVIIHTYVRMYTYANLFKSPSSSPVKFSVCNF